MKKRSIILITLLVSCVWAFRSFAQDFMINGYIPNYRSLAQYNAVDYDNLDIAFYAFINNNSDGSLVPLSAGNLSKLEAMVTNAHAAGKKAYISLGGQFGGGVIFEMANNSTARAAFVQNISWNCMISMAWTLTGKAWKMLLNVRHMRTSWLI